jgi:hypothetical protein
MIELIKYTIPALAVISTTWLLLHNFIKIADRKAKAELMLKNNDIILPLRLQAYERMILFLERISIDQLLTRLNQPGTNSRQLHSELLTTIRSEFEHNVTQQLYISPQSWEQVRSARAQMIKLINTSFEQTDPNKSGIELSRKILENMSEMDKMPTQIAVETLKSEVQSLF